MNIEGCVHIHVKNGKMMNAFSYLSNVPENCIIHLQPQVIFYTEEEFKQDHYKHDVSEELRLNESSEGKFFDLGDS